MRTTGGTSAVVPASAAGTAGATGTRGGAGRTVRAGGGAELLGLDRARVELGLDQDEFDVALQLGEVRTVTCALGMWKVPRHEVARVAGLPGHPEALLERIRLVFGAAAAETMGAGRDRFVRLARAGCVHPVRWYVNQYRAVVWMYRAADLEDFAVAHPDLLRGRLPATLPKGLRAALDDGEDRRPRGWRARRTAQLVRDAFDAWEEAAVWAALLGPDIVADAVPDPYERAQLHRLRAVLPPGRPGRATPEQVRTLTRADASEEITAGLLALGDALGRARALRAAPRPLAEGAVRQGTVRPGSAATVTAAGSPAPTRALALPVARPAPDLLAAAVPARRLPATPATPADVVPVEQLRASPAVAAPAVGALAATRVRQGLRRLLATRRRPAERRPPAAQSSPTSVRRITARPSSSEAARSTSAEMPQP